MYIRVRVCICVEENDPAMRLTASSAPELDWQLALMRRGSPSKKNF